MIHLKSLETHRMRVFIHDTGLNAATYLIKNKWHKLDLESLPKLYLEECQNVEKEKHMQIQGNV